MKKIKERKRIAKAEAKLTEAHEAIQEVRNEEELRYLALSVSLQEGALGGRMQEAINGLDQIANEVDELKMRLGEIWESTR